jgi:hypothetical protein
LANLRRGGDRKSEEIKGPGDPLINDSDVKGSRKENSPDHEALPRFCEIAAIAGLRDRDHKLCDILANMKVFTHAI